MTYLELYEQAERKLEHNEITVGEFDEMIKPLRREIEPEWTRCSECMPELYRPVLTVAKGDRVRENFLINANSNEWSYDSYSVRAWMPLPRSPLED